MPAGEALQQGLHKLAEVMHPVGEPLMNPLHIGLPIHCHPLRHQLPRTGQLLGHGRNISLRIKRPQPFEQLLIRQRHLRPRRDFEQDVEMIAHDAVSQHPAAEKFSIIRM
jgi:hypothetical protein